MLIQIYHQPPPSLSEPEFKPQNSCEERLGMVEPTCDSDTEEIKTGRSLELAGQSVLPNW